MGERQRVLRLHLAEDVADRAPRLRAVLRACRVGQSNRNYINAAAVGVEEDDEDDNNNMMWMMNAVVVEEEDNNNMGEGGW